MGCSSKRNEKKSVQTFPFFLHIGIEALEEESAAVFLPEKDLLTGVACHHVHYVQEERKWTVARHAPVQPVPSRSDSGSNATALRRTMVLISICFLRR